MNEQLTLQGGLLAQPLDVRGDHRDRRLRGAVDHLTDAAERKAEIAQAANLLQPRQLSLGVATVSCRRPPAGAQQPDRLVVMEGPHGHPAVAREVTNAPGGRLGG